MTMSPDAEVQLGRADRGTIRTIAICAALMGVAFGAGQIIRALTVLFAPEVTLTLLTVDAPLPVTSPAGVASAAVASASVTADFAQSVRLLFALGHVIFGATAIVLGAAAAWLLWTIASGIGFSITLYRLVLAAGCTLVLGPMLGTAVQGFGAMEAGHTTNDALGGILLVGFGVDEWGFAIPIVGLTVLALGYVFQAMGRLQRETDGLV